MAENNTLATSAEAADYLHVTQGALAQMRYLNAGPTYIRLGHKTIRYRWSDLRAYVDANAVEAAS